jgi:hypothetical protein
VQICAPGSGIGGRKNESFRDGIGRWAIRRNEPISQRSLAPRADCAILCSVVPISRPENQPFRVGSVARSEFAKRTQFAAVALVPRQTGLMAGFCELARTKTHDSSSDFRVKPKSQAEMDSWPEGDDLLARKNIEFL